MEHTSAALGEAVGTVYVQKYFTAETKAQAREIVDNVMRAFAARLDRLNWMGPETKAHAKEKLANFRVMVGYPDKWRDYSTMQIISGDAYGTGSALSAGIPDHFRAGT